MRSTGRENAGAIDAAITAEDTPAYVQIDRAKNAMANASARDWGHAVGSVAGNVALSVAPSAAATKLSALRRFRKKRDITLGREPPKVTWVDENASMSDAAKKYNDGAMGARSNAITKRSQAPALERDTRKGVKKYVNFDGVDRHAMIDRKISIRRNEKAKKQARSQDEVLKKHDLRGIWEVPTTAQRKEAIRFLYRLGISTIEVRVVKQ